MHQREDGRAPPGEHPGEARHARPRRPDALRDPARLRRALNRRSRASESAAFAASGSPFVSLLTAIPPRSRVSTLCAGKAAAFTLSAMTAATIRVLVVDDHPAVRQGIEAMLGHEDGIVCIGTAASAGAAHELWPAAERLPADVVVLVDRHLPDEDGLSLCLWLRTCTPAPAVVMYSAFADEALGCRWSSPGPAR